MPTATPHGVCDCHVHIYEDRFALAASATFKPPHAPVSAYRQVQRALGLQRVVLVQPTGYGFDNACLLDALAQLGDGAIGVAVVPPDVERRRTAAPARRRCARRALHDAGRRPSLAVGHAAGDGHAHRARWAGTSICSSTAARRRSARP